MLPNRKISTILKYGAVLVSIFILLLRISNYTLAFVQLIELGAVFLLTQLIFRYNSKLAIITNDILILLIEIQILVYFFTNTYLSMMMLANIKLYKDLGDSLPLYAVAGLVVLFVSLLPIEDISSCRQIRKKSNKIISITLLSFIILLSASSSFLDINSPMFAYGKLGIEYSKIKKAERQLAKPSSANKEAFFNSQVDDAVASKMGSAPNVVLIFTEGFSRRAIDDEKNITPNISAWEKKTVSFKNYYNHTAATYRGLIGQLYSGEQFSNLDSNSLISLNDIMRKNGYYTTFINTEPGNKEWSPWLPNLDFDKIIEREDLRQKKLHWITDNNAYDLLKEEIKGWKDDSPQMVSIYTFGTHVGLDSPDAVYGNGKNPVLNKFYNLDNEFSKFMDWFETSKETDNTVLIFTADHCAYGNTQFIETFDLGKDTPAWIDEIPLMIYYKGIEPRVIDANGRNSLDLAPTIIDCLDLENNSENYFLGKTLFMDQGETAYNTTFYGGKDIPEIASTANGKVKYLKDKEYESSMKKMLKYLSVSKTKSMKQDHL